MHITIIGCGYTGTRLARRCRASGDDVMAVVGSASSLTRLEAKGITARQIDLDSRAGVAVPADLVCDRALIYMVPPCSEGDTDKRLARFLAALQDRPRCLAYLSTSAVYGDCGGANTDESTPPSPSGQGGLRRLDAETRTIAWGGEHGVAVRILRVPAIYGPGRLPLERIAQGAPVVARSEGRPGNRIHVDDLVSACLAAVSYEGPHTVFNVGDGDHTDMAGYFRMVARHAGLPDPPELPLQEVLARVSPAMQGFISDSRRLDIRRMREVLGVTLLHADLEQGVLASLAEQADSGRD